MPGDLTHPSRVREILSRWGLQPNRTLGQNFLIDTNIRDIIIDAAGIREEDCVLEIGPGLGALTEAMIGLCRQVVAVEKDHGLYRHLTEIFSGSLNLNLIEGDALGLGIDTLLRDHDISVLVSNLPYSVGSRILVDAALSPRRPRSITVTVQREVADRMAAPCGSADYGILGIFLQLDYEVHVRKHISRTCFFPPPAVRSSVVTLTRRTERLHPLHDEHLFRNLVRFAFEHRRKQLIAILKRWPAASSTPEAIPAMLPSAGLAPDIRPERVSVTEWIRLANAAAEARDR